MYLADDFKSALDGFDLQHLDRTASATLGLRRDLTIGMANRAWSDGGSHCGGGRGYPSDGTDYLGLLAPEQRAAVEPLLRGVLRSREPALLEYEVACPDGGTVPYRLRVMPLQDGLLLVHHCLRPPARASA